MSPYPWLTRLNWKELFVSTSSSTAPLKIELFDPQELCDPFGKLVHRDACVTIDTDAYLTEKIVTQLVSLIKADIYSIQFVRGFNHRGEFARGVFLLDANGTVIVHITNALIGYDGSGPALSRRILELFGFSQQAFHNINDTVRPSQQHYGLTLRIV
jgi:hypothetical protein